MVNINPKKAGDLVYPQYAVIRTFELASAQSATKGHIMTTDADGRLTPITAVGGRITNAKGLFQIIADRGAQTYHATNNPIRPTVQAAITTSWVLLKAAADVTAGDRVTLVTPTDTTVTPDTVVTSGDSLVIGVSFTAFVGRVYRIYTVDETETPKKTKTVADDLVVVMLGEL